MQTLDLSKPAQARLACAPTLDPVSQDLARTTALCLDVRLWKQRKREQDDCAAGPGELHAELERVTGRTISLPELCHWLNPEADRPMPARFECAFIAVTGGRNLRAHHAQLHGLSLVHQLELADPGDRSRTATPADRGADELARLRAELGQAREHSEAVPAARTHGPRRSPRLQDPQVLSER